MTGSAPAARCERLTAAAEEAAQLRMLMIDPDVVALRVEKVRKQVDAMLWTAIVLGLAFTMTNVQAFGAHGAPAWTTAWCAAWLLDPIPSLALLAILRAEQVTARYQLTLPTWAGRTKWLTFAATYAMNTWQSWGLGDRELTPSGVVLHSVPPLVVLFAAETGPGLRDRLTEAVNRALVEAGRDRTAGSAAAVRDRPATNPDWSGERDEPHVPGERAGAAVPDARPVPATESITARRERAVAQRTPVRLGLGREGAAGGRSPVLAAVRPPQSGTDRRVRQVEQRLAAGEALTGESVGDLFDVSERTGRRILAAAQARLPARGVRAAAGSHGS